MASAGKTWAALKAGQRDVRFDDLVRLAEGFGFVLVRIRGSHHILHHSEVPGALNLQPEGRRAKLYQVRQLLTLVERYRLTLRGGPE